MSILGELAAVELEKATAALRTLWGRLKAETRDGTSLPVRRLVMPCSSDGHAIDRFVVGLFLYRPQSF